MWPSFLETWSRGRRQLLLAGVVLVVVTAGLAGAYFAWLKSPYEPLARGLRPTEAAAIVAELDKRKTPYRLDDGGATILVPRKIADATRLAISGQELPLKGAVGFELFNKSDMGLTEFAQQVNYRRALQGELTRTLLEIDGIEGARVHLSLPEPSVFRDDRMPAKASVTLTPKLGHTLSPATVAGVQRLVAAVAPELEPGAVVVLDERGVVVSETLETSPSGPLLGVEDYVAGVVELAVRQRLRQRAFSVIVKAPPTAEAAAWRPSAEVDGTSPRTFPLVVEVRVDTALSPAERSEVQGLAISAAGLQPALGDRLVIEDASAGAAPEPASAPRAIPAVVAAQDRAFGAQFQVALVGALVVLLLGAWTISRRVARDRGLSEGRKERLAQRFAALLSEEAQVVTRD